MQKELAAYQAFGSGMHEVTTRALNLPQLSFFDRVQLVTATNDCAMSASNAS